MATPKKNVSSIVLASSDVIYDFYCEPCSTEELNVEAAGYCEQCKEYLCNVCCNYHRKSTALKHHTVLDTASMPRTKITPKVRDVLTEMCPKHNDKVLEYFCKKHEALCCSVCMSIEHKSCKKKSYIPDISDGSSSSKEYKDIATQLERIVTKATKELMRADVNGNDNDANLAKAVSDIKAFRLEMDKVLDTVVGEAIQDVTRVHKENSDKIKSSRQRCQSVLSDMNAKSMTLENKAKASKNNQLFVDMKLTRHLLPTIEKDIQCLIDRKFSHFKLDKNDKVQKLRATMSALFTLSFRKEGAEANARYLKEVNVKSEEDNTDCNITGIAVVAQDRLVVTDYKNVAVKLVDVRQNSVISRLPMSCGPYDVTRTAPTTVAVVLGKEQKIDILVVSSVLTRSRTINMQGDMFKSLCHIGDKFILLYTQPCAVKTVDASGVVLNTIFQDKDTDPLFKKPRYIASSRCHDAIYITDQDANTVTTMTLKGDIVSVYKNVEIKYPKGVTAGRDGVVYMSSEHNHTVHQLRTTGQYMKVLLDQQRGLATYPKAISYDEDGSRLLVSSANSSHKEQNYVRLFQLE